MWSEANMMLLLFVMMKKKTAGIMKVVTFTLPSAYTVGYRLMDWRSTTGKTHPTLKLLSVTVPH
jgi:hypothetical protein